MAVRFKTTFKNALNELYTIHIHDADFAGAETLYVASGEGFELTQDGDGDNLYSPIIYTSAMIFMHVQDINRTEIEDFIADIVDSQDENRFTVVIYDGNGQVFFRGKVQFERILIPDRYFNQITINASDGFGRLRSIPYSDNGTLYEGWETVRGHLFNVLSKLNLFGYGNNTTNSTAYANKITYDNVTSNTFNELRFQHDAMKEIKTDGTVLPFSCHDVLTQILTRFGCRIVQMAGVFHIQELTALAEAGPMDVYFYDKDGDFDSVYPYSYNTAIIQKLAGGQTWFREPAKSVRLDYEYRDAVGGSNLSQEIIPWKTWKNIGMVPAGNGERVAFNFDFSVEHQAGGTATMYYITYEFAIRTGTYWLSNAGGVVQWINGDNTARYKVTNMFEIDDGIAINLIHEVSFIIPELPFTGDLNVYWDWAKTRSNGAAPITPPTGIDTITNLQNVIVLLYSTTEFDINEGTIVTMATGSTTSGEQVELGTVVIGDLPFLRSIGRIQRYVALGQWENTSLKWGHGGPELLSLTHMVTREILSLRRKNTKIIAYVIRSRYAGAANKIIGNVVTRASYRANSGIWDIETFVPVFDRGGIAWSDYVETDQIGGAPGGITLPPPPAGTFIGLNDTPVSYAGQAGKVPQVNSAETGLEWGSGGGGSSYEYWKLKGGKVPKFGLLYNWYAATDVRNICAKGWEVPTLAQIAILVTYLGGNAVAAGHLKETGTTYWNVANADNSSNFNSRGAAQRLVNDGSFSNLKEQFHAWSVTENAGTYYSFENQAGTTAMSYAYRSPKFGHSIRLIKTTTTLTHGQTGTYTGNDGKVYRTICIGTQEWLADNLCETKFRNGDAIPEVTDNSAWAALTTGALCAYDNDWDNVFMQNDVNINSHDRVTFKDSETIAFEVVDWGSGQKQITAFTPSDGTPPVADGTYTVGIGSTQNGTITTKGGIITAIQEAIQKLVATLTATGDGTGVSTLRMEVSETQTFTLDGAARFYTDAAGTTGESTTWNVTAGTLWTIYLKCPSGTANLTIPKPDKVIKWGNYSQDGWTSSTNAAEITIEVGKLALTELRISSKSTLTGALPTGLTYLRLIGALINWTYSGALPTGLTYLTLNSALINWTYSGALPTDLTFLRLIGTSINWTYSGALPTGLTYLRLDGNSINWTGLNVGNNGNIDTFNLLNYRTDNMSSPDMVTLLTQLTNRTGTLPATITINDYADYASPPQAVTDAVAALKIAKSITTVNLGQ